MQLNAMPAQPAPSGSTSAVSRLFAWQAWGLCRDVEDPEIFYPEPWESADVALATCAACPVRAACLTYALDTGEQHGIWGGTTEDERREWIRSDHHTATSRDHRPMDSTTSPVRQEVAA